MLDQFLAIARDSTGRDLDLRIGRIDLLQSLQHDLDRLTITGHIFAVEQLILLAYDDHFSGGRARIDADIDRLSVAL